MTEEDQQVLRRLMREEMQPLRAELAAGLEAVRAEFRAALEAVRADFAGRLDRAVESLTMNLSDVREELIRRLDTVDRRLDRVETNVTAIQFQTAGMSKSLTDAERLDTSIVATQAAQQRAIDALAARIARIEQELHPGERH